MTTDQQADVSRFARVQQILRDAAHGRPAAYGGQRLWEYTRDQLVEAELYGLRLVAAAGEGACGCGCAAETGARSARSPLIQGLRGQTPFDGSQFLQLPWGGQPLSCDEIDFISAWIDDGCPAAGRDIPLYQQSPITLEPARVARAQVADLDRQLQSLTPAAASEYRHQHGELKQRMNIDCMDEAQLEKLRYAFRGLYDLNKWPGDIRNYNNLALIHQNHCQHGWERFLTWHRAYLYEFEQALQDICPDVTLPYWDWTMPQYKPEDPGTGLRIPLALQAYLTEEALALLGKHGIPTKPLHDLVRSPETLTPSYALLSTFFQAVAQRIDAKYTEGEYRHRFIDALLDANALWYPLRYPGEFFTAQGQPSTINARIQFHYPTADDIEQIMSLRTFRDFGGGSLYNDSFGFLDQNPHNTLHIWTGGQNPRYDPSQPSGERQVPQPRDRNRAVRVAGRRFHKREDLYSEPQYGDMFSNLTASYDPVFWPIHANVDRLWWEWQQLNPNANPQDLDAVLPPWNYTARDTLDISYFGYEYVKSTCLIPVGLGAPVGRFVSAAVPVPELVRASFRNAEVRLHRVPQLLRSCFVRVFLNLPDANAATSIQHPNYAGYLAIFGHGSCYGGPGHCDIPQQRRAHDQRSRDHNTPRNHRINVTRCARRLLDAGAQQLQITLVVIGVDYQEDSELLRLDGVSLNFLD